jgi:hypothetical protein
VNDFVEECRSEWKRLGVADAVANEMAADLAADLEEAEAEGVSAEEVLGSGSFDPHSFAAAWAAERGVIRRPVRSARALTRESRLATAIGTLALVIAIVGAVLVIVDARSDPERLTLASFVDVPRAVVWAAPSAVRAPAPPPGAFTFDAEGRVIMLPLPAAPGDRIVAADESGVDSRTVGLILLIVGCAGVVGSTLFLLWVAPRLRTNQPSDVM